MEPGPQTKQNRQAAFVRAGAASVAFFIPIIVAAAYLNMGQTCSCGSTCPPDPPDFRVSKSTGGVAADDASIDGAVAAQGNDIAFASYATNLDPAAASVPGPHVFVHNISTKATDWVSLAAFGEPDAIGSGSPVLSQYGQFVAFEQQFFGMPATHAIVFRDLDAVTPSFETIASTGTTPVSDPTMSGDGRYVAFATTATLVPEDTDAASDVYLKDRWMGTLILRSDDAGTVDAIRPKLSRDGQWITYDVDGGFPGLIVVDVERIQGLAGLTGDLPSLSDDGSLVAFRRKVGGVYRIFVEPPFGIDPSEEVSIDASGIPTTDDCDNPVISGNGRYVAFSCIEAMTDHGALNQVYVRDLVEQTTKLASISDTGGPANTADSKPVGMPANGNALIIESSANNLGNVPGGFPQLFRIPISYWDEGGSTCAADDATCDGNDDDCDGQTDEDYISQATNCGVGACASTGSTSCVGGVEQNSCVPFSGTPEGSVCNGIDDDCDGVVDEDYVDIPSTCGFGPCESTGLLLCQSGIVVDTCTPGVPSATDDTTCDGIDDDCDGQVDEDCTCATCQDYNINCGTVDDGCGGMIDCGVCTGEETCGGGGTANVCGIPLPPDPSDVAPSGDVGAGSTLESFGFLVDPANPIQTEVSDGALEEERVGLVRGAVLDTAGTPLPAVEVRIVSDAALGKTLSRADGRYDLLVNGGEEVTLQFEANGYLPVQRRVEVSWEGFLEVPDVVLTVKSDVASDVQFGAAATQPQVVESRMVSDDDGTRKVTGFLPTGVQALAEVDGQSVEITNGMLRITEFTVGPSGEKAMPGGLPDNSLYTFAADMSLEDEELGTLSKVEFSDRTYFYLDNFLDHAVGALVPSGYYDYELAQWVAGPDGLVMQVVGVTPEGLAEIDATHEEPDPDALPESAADLALLGMTDDERRTIAEQFNVGDTFWRMPIEHLTPWDWNHAGFRLEPPPPKPPAQDGDAKPCGSDEDEGSIIKCQGRGLAETIPISGTPYSLRYESDRAAANVTADRIAIIEFPEPEHIPDQAVSFVFRADILGRTLVEVELPLGTESYTVEWDGLDAYGRPWLGSARLKYRISYRFTPRYQMALVASITGEEARSTFGNAICNANTDPCCVRGGGSSISFLPVAPNARQDSFLSFAREIPMGPSGGSGFGGWSLSHYHRYDPTSQVLIRGDGTTSTSVRRSAVPTILAGRTSDGDDSNDVASSNAEFAEITRPGEIAVAPDGTVYFEWSSESPFRRIWRVRRQGNIEPVVDFDDYPDVSCEPTDLAVDDEGALYVACPPNGLYRLEERTDGPWDIELLVGTGSNYVGEPWQDGEPLTGGKVWPESIAFREDGTMFFTAIQGGPWGANNHGLSGRVWELVEYLPDGRGRIVEPAATGANGDAIVLHVHQRIAAGPDNSIVAYNFWDSSGRVMQIFPNGVASILMDSTGIDAGFEWESTETHRAGLSRNFYADIASSPNGDIYLAFDPDNCNGHKIYQISRAGEIRQVSVEGLPQDLMFGPNTCIQTAIDKSGGAMVKRLAVGPDGLLYVTDRIMHRIYTIGAEDDGDAAGSDFEVVSEDGSEVYFFSAEGLHQSTQDAQTGIELFRFTHVDGVLTEVIDRDGRVTAIQRPDSSTIRVVPPGGPGGATGEATTLTLNSDGYLDQLVDPRGETWAFEYLATAPATAGQGLLSKLWDPRANDNGVRAGDPYVFEYEPANSDPNARLVLRRDIDPVTGEKNLIKVQQSSTRTVEPVYARWCDGSEYVRGYRITNTTTEIAKTDSLGRTTNFTTVLAHGSPRWLGRTAGRAGHLTTTRTEPNGWFVTRLDPNRKNEGYVRWPGASFDYELTAHERLGSGVLVPETSTLHYNGLSGTFARGPLDQTTTVEWDTDFTPLLGFSPAGIETVRTTVSTAASARTMVTTYDESTSKVSATSPELRTSSYTLDDRSRVERVELPGQVPTVFGYDSEGFLRTVTRTKGASTRVTTFDYDTRGYVNEVTNRVSDSVTDEVTMQNDPMGFALQTQVPGLLTVGSTPDSAGALSSLTPDGKPSHQLAYTQLGQLSQYASPAGSISTDGTCPSGTQCWRYSRARELEEITLPDGTSIDYDYGTTTGNLDSVTVPDHGTTTFFYDLGRRSSAIAPTGGSMSFAWQSTLPIATTWQGAHTLAGVAGTFTLDGSVERVYNDFLEVSELRVTGGKKLRLVRDRDGLVEQIADVDGVFPTLMLNRSDVDGHVASTTLDTVTTSVVLDIDDGAPGSELGFGDLLFTFADAGTDNLYDTAYTYDDRGRIDTWTETVEADATRTRKFGYDAAGRLVTVHDVTDGAPGTLLEEYAYDGNGNRQKALSNYPGAVPLDTEFPSGIRCPGPSGDTAADDQDQLCEYGGFTYSYNARGQLESRSDGAATTTYSYDGLGRLKRVTEPGMDLHYIHDALGRRIGKVRDGNLEKGWLYADALNPIAELDSSGNVEATFVYGTRAHVPDAMVMTDGTVYRFITDHLGSVRLVVNAETGEVVQRVDYDAFGRVLNDTNEGFQPFGFAGGLYDDDTGLVRFGARDYDAYTGRWTAKDPILFDGGDENLYAYVINDPVNLLDPIGLAWYDYFDTSHDGLLQGFADFATGVADAASFGLGPLARASLDKNWGTDVSTGVNPCSNAYRAGTWASLIIGGGRSAYALAAKAQSLGRTATMQSAYKAWSARNSIRKAFRAHIPGGGKTWSETLTKYGPDPGAIIQGSGRTNLGYTAPGANLAIGGGVGAAQQPPPW